MAVLAMEATIEEPSEYRLREVRSLKNVFQSRGASWLYEDVFAEAAEVVELERMQDRWTATLAMLRTCWDRDDLRTFACMRFWKGELFWHFETVPAGCLRWFVEMLRQDCWNELVEYANGARGPEEIRVPSAAVRKGALRAVICIASQACQVIDWCP